MIINAINEMPLSVYGNGINVRDWLYVTDHCSAIDMIMHRGQIVEVLIFSRDEKKQDNMHHEFQAKMPEVAEKIKFYIGDVRDLRSVKNAMHGLDYIFHAAALKQVPSCEFFNGDRAHKRDRNR